MDANAPEFIPPGAPSLSADAAEFVPPGASRRGVAATLTPSGGSPGSNGVGMNSDAPVFVPFRLPASVSGAASLNSPVNSCGGGGGASAVPVLSLDNELGSANGLSSTGIPMAEDEAAAMAAAHPVLKDFLEQSDQASACGRTPGGASAASSIPSSASPAASLPSPSSSRDAAQRVQKQKVEQRSSQEASSPQQGEDTRSQKSGYGVGSGLDQRTQSYGVGSATNPGDRTQGYGLGSASDFADLPGAIAETKEVLSPESKEVLSQMEEFFENAYFLKSKMQSNRQAFEEKDAQLSALAEEVARLEKLRREEVDGLEDARRKEVDRLERLRRDEVDRLDRIRQEEAEKLEAASRRGRDLEDQLRELQLQHQDDSLKLLEVDLATRHNISSVALLVLLLGALVFMCHAPRQPSAKWESPAAGYDPRESAPPSWRDGQASSSAEAVASTESESAPRQPAAKWESPAAGYDPQGSAAPSWRDGAQASSTRLFLRWLARLHYPQVADR